jgi:prepilin-type N-terminal cleavage/methylation domain-containing protein
MKSTTTTRKGFTLIELLLVVGFISLAGIGIYTIYNKVQASNTALTEAKNLEVLRTGMKMLYGSSQNYTGLNNSVLNDARITPDSMRKIPYTSGDGSITTSYGGSVWVTPSLGASNRFDHVWIQYSSVPGDVCVKFVAAVTLSWERVYVGYSTLQSVNSAANAPIDSVKLATACAGDTGSGVTIAFLGS